jgi:hypothetical protein
MGKLAGEGFLDPEPHHVRHRVGRAAFYSPAVEKLDQTPAAAEPLDRRSGRSHDRLVRE